MPFGFVDLAQTRVTCEKETLIEKVPSSDCLQANLGIFSKPTIERAQQQRVVPSLQFWVIYHLKLSRPWRRSHQAVLPHDLCCRSFPDGRGPNSSRCYHHYSSGLSTISDRAGPGEGATKPHCPMIAHDSRSFPDFLSWLTIRYKPNNYFL